MLIQRLKIKGFRNVPDQDLEINGCNVLCYGDNGVGKSNLITCVHALLAAKFPPGSIKHGMDKAEVEAVLADFVRGDDPSTWVPVDGTEHVMRAHIYTNKKGEQQVDIELHYPSGGADDQVTKIRTYIGQAPLQYNFVELSRTEKGRAEQMKILRSMFPSDLQEKLNQIETKIRLAEKDRLQTGRERDNSWGFIKKSNITKEDVEKYITKIDVAKVMDERSAGHKINEERAGVIQRRNERLEQITAISALITEVEEHKHKLLSYMIPGGTVDFKGTTLRNALEQTWEEIKTVVEVSLQENVATRLKRDIEALEAKNKDANNWLEKNQEQDLSTYDKQLKDAEHHNSMVDKVAEYNKLLKEAQELDNTYGEYDALVQTAREQFKETVRSFDLPVPGLTFDDTTVMYKGKPVDEENTSTAERMMIDAMLSISCMDKAQILFMERGESLGKANYMELKELCDSNGIQLFLEQVERQDSKELRVVVECGGTEETPESTTAD